MGAIWFGIALSVGWIWLAVVQTRKCNELEREHQERVRAETAERFPPSEAFKVRRVPPKK